MGVLRAALDEAIAESGAAWFRPRKANGQRSTSWRLAAANSDTLFVMVWADSTKFTVKTSDPKGFFQRCDDPRTAVELGERVAAGLYDSSDAKGMPNNVGIAREVSTNGRA